MDDTVAPYQEEPTACPFVALEDDRDRRTERPDYRHRCFASRQPEPRAFPHQERYCLSRGFTDCPIFLDWARREAASVIPARRPQPAPAAAAAAAPAEDDDVAAEGLAAAGAAVPPFLAGRTGRAAAHVEDAPGPTPDPDEGLWGPEDAARRRPVGVVGRARSNVKHPEWESAPHVESYPRIRHRGRLGGGLSIPPIVPIVLVVLAVALVSFLVLPGILWPANSGHAPKPSASNASPVVTATPAPTPVPSPTQFSYTIKKGDTLTSISNKFCVSIEDILNANKDTIKNADSVAEGQAIVIPPSAGCGAASPSASTKP